MQTRSSLFQPEDSPHSPQRHSHGVSNALRAASFTNSKTGKAPLEITELANFTYGDHPEVPPSFEPAISSVSGKSTLHSFYWWSAIFGASIPGCPRAARVLSWLSLTVQIFVILAFIAVLVLNKGRVGPSVFLAHTFVIPMTRQAMSIVFLQWLPRTTLVCKRDGTGKHRLYDDVDIWLSSGLQGWNRRSLAVALFPTIGYFLKDVPAYLLGDLYEENREAIEWIRPIYWAACFSFSGAIAATSIFTAHLVKGVQDAISIDATCDPDTQAQEKLLRARIIFEGVETKFEETGARHIKSFVEFFFAFQLFHLLFILWTLWDVYYGRGTYVSTDKVEVTILYYLGSATLEVFFSIGILMPAVSVNSSIDDMIRNLKGILYCQDGVRASDVLAFQFLTERGFGFKIMSARISQETFARGVLTSIAFLLTILSRFISTS